MEGDENFVVTAKDRRFLPYYHPQEQEWTGPFYFLQAADTQLGMQEKWLGERKNYGWSQEVAWTRQMVKDINQMTPLPKFLVICGDFLEAWPNSEAATRALQEKDLKKELVSLRVPLVCVCGNHDVGDTPTPATVTSYRASFGDDFFSFWCGGVFFLVVNSQYWVDSSQTEDLAAEHEAWLDEQLKVVEREKPRHAVVFQHIPYFIYDADEEKEYFNMPPELRHRLLAKLYDAGVRYVFCGHYHRNAGGRYRDLEQTVTSAVGVQLGDDENGFRIVKVLEDRLEHTYYPLGAAPTCITLFSVVSKPDHADASRPTAAWSQTAKTSASPAIVRKSSHVV